jgi:hypothetical protein
MERVVNIYADGRLAYTGFLSLAAHRLGTTERALQLTIDNNLRLPIPREKRGYETDDGLWPSRERAKSYVAKWRDA